MTAKERVLAIRVAEKVRRQPEVAARAGVWFVKVDAKGPASPDEAEGQGLFINICNSTDLFTQT